MRMRKRVLASFVIIAGLVCVFAFGPAYSQEEIKVLADKAFEVEGRQRPAAVFPHEEHNETAGLDECSTCHHQYEGDTKVEDESTEGQPCSDCHNVKQGHPTRPLMKAYHNLCKGCHEENGKGPVTCGECHRK
jgi:predicted CXXCH cytochrome family protein